MQTFIHFSPLILAALIVGIAFTAFMDRRTRRRDARRPRLLILNVRTFNAPPIYHLNNCNPRRGRWHSPVRINNR